MNTQHTTEPAVVSEAMIPTADSLHRGVKLALDSGEVDSVAAGYDLFRSYRLAVLAGPRVADSPAHQTAVLTIVNTARRAMLGGVTVSGECDVPLLVSHPHSRTLADAVVSLGGIITLDPPSGVPLLTVGVSAPPPATHPVSLAVTFAGWRGGVIPTSFGCTLDESAAISTAAVLAGALGVSEVFQFLRGNPMAGSRSVGMSLWSPEEPAWENASDGPTSILLPSRLWLIGLGHLGQAYLWTLGLLPYRVPNDVELVFQDFDHLTLANDSTSLLTSPKLVGRRKTRAMADWAEERGFRTRLVERLFPGGLAIGDDEPRLALGGVDNLQARAAFEDAGFDCVIEAGLGAGPSEFLAVRMHSFPASTTARKKWTGSNNPPVSPFQRATAYTALADQGVEECGLVQLATRTVGAPFVGAVASTLVIAEVLRLLNGGMQYEVIDLTLRDLNSREAVRTSRRSDQWNPGYTN